MPATFLLDTHILLWWLGNTGRLPADCLKLLEDKKTKLAISAATVWEIEIKRNLGKLSAPPDPTSTNPSQQHRTATHLL